MSPISALMKKSKAYRFGFSLLEIMAVVVIIGILGAGATLVFRGPLNRARESNFREQLISIQLRCREQCRRQSAAGQLTINRNSVEWRFQGRNKRESLGDACRIESVLSQDGTLRYAKSVFIFSFQGISECFAMQIQPRTGKSYWLLCIGGTGECLEIATESDVRRYLNEFRNM